MKTKLIGQIISASVLLLMANAVSGTIPSSALTTYVTAPSSSVDPDLSFSLTMGLQTPTNFSDQSVSTYFGHYYIPDDLEYLFASTTNCGRLSGIKQVSCVLYTLNANQILPSDNAPNYQLQFKLKDPVTFCRGTSGVKTINAGILSITPQTSFSPGLTNININCAALDSPSSNNTNVDIVTSYDTLPAARVENNNSFPVKIRLYNAHSNALDIDNVSARLQVPTVFEMVSLASGCNIDANNLITCNIGNLANVVTKDFQFRLKSGSTCTNSAGNYNFSLSANSSGSLPGKTRTEINSSNNTNIGASTVVACPGGTIPNSGNSVQFKIINSSIVVSNPNGDMSVGSAGRYSGTIDYRLQVTNTTSQDMRVRLFDYVLPSFRLIFVSPTVVNSCTSSPYTNVSCNTTYLTPGASISQDFRLQIIYPNPYGDKSPFNPVMLCDSKIRIAPNDPNINLTDVAILDQLSGWTNNSPGDYVLESQLDISAIPGLNCTNRTYTP